MDTLTRERTPQVERLRQIDRIWADWRIGLAFAVGIVAVAGLVAAWLTPRGPLTGTQALVSMAAAVAVGVLAGAAMGSRWSMLATPVVFIVAFEVGRIGTAGPTVDAINLTAMLGVFAFVVGRVAHGLIVLPPLVLGAGAGVWLAHRLGNHHAPSPGMPGRIVMGVMALGIVGLAVALARPASTAPILGPDGQPLSGSIAEFATVEIGGVDQVMLIRGTDSDNPVLLHLSGGPGGTDLGAMRADTELEQDFVVVTWDQRGTGKSYATSIDPVQDLTVDQSVADTIEVATYLRDRFGQDRIFLTANSWGTIPSVYAVQRQPELFHAYIGTGQMVDNRETDQMFYDDALAWAQQVGNVGLADQIRDAGPPPYDNLLDYTYTVSYEHQWNAYPGVDDLWEMPFNVFVPENTLMDRINATRAMFDVNWFVYPQLQDYDFREEVTSLEVPVHLVLGRHEARGRDVPAREWFELLQAPSKELVVFDDAGHRPSFEQPHEFAELMASVKADSDP